MEPEGAPRVRREERPPPSLGRGPGALAAALEPALFEAAGPGAVLVSVTLEPAETPPEGAALQVEAWVERATRTLVFVAAEISADGRPAATAAAVFSREAEAREESSAR